MWSVVSRSVPQYFKQKITTMEDDFIETKPGFCHQLVVLDGEELTPRTDFPLTSRG